MNDRKNDPIEKLIQATGPRPAVPDDTTRRVKAAVHRHWRATVEDNRPQRRWRTGLTLAAAAALLFTVGLIAWDRFGPGSGTGEPVLVVAVTGSTPLAIGDRLEAGARISTPQDGGMAIRTAPGRSVRLDSGTSVHLLATDTLVLEQGAIYVDTDVSGENGPGPLSIRTPLGSFREIGTQFEIRMTEGQVRARVREGSIEVEHKSEELQVVAGHEMEINYRGEVRRGEIDPASPEWGWIGELTPMMEIDGRPALAFLNWIARERGLQLQFEDTALFSSAGVTDLNGSIGGMSLDQALDAVLPTCGMTHHIHDGTLTVNRADD